MGAIRKQDQLLRRGKIARLSAMGYSAEGCAEEAGCGINTVYRDREWLAQNGAVTVGLLEPIYQTLGVMAGDAAQENDYLKLIRIAKAIMDIEDHRISPAGQIVEGEKMRDVAEQYVLAVAEVHAKAADEEPS